jgi:biopolymer transport protein ExbD
MAVNKRRRRLLGAAAMPDIEALVERLKKEPSRSRSPRCTSAVTTSALRIVGRVVVACQRAGIAKVGFITEPPAALASA